MWIVNGLGTNGGLEVFWGGFFWVLFPVSISFCVNHVQLINLSADDPSELVFYI